MDKQKLLIGGAVLVSVIILVLIVSKLFMKTGGSGTNVISPTEMVEEVIPTVDSSVVVKLESATNGREVVLTIDNVPSKTTSIDYELSYQTEKQGLQGVIGTIKAEESKSYEKKLTLGTCSSGTCVYHQVVGPIKLNLRFTGEYGEQVWEKEVTL